MGREILRRATLALIAIGLLSLPALGNSGGPPYLNGDGNLTSEYGCSCHNNGQISDRAVVMVTGVPIQYSLAEQYQFTIHVADAHVLAGDDGNVKAGFVITSGNVGSFTWEPDQNLRIAEDSEGDVSHSETSDTGIWALTWHAPSADEGNVHFWVAGNSVNGDGAPGDDDYWNMLSFTINAPGTLENDDQAQTLEWTVSVGAYDSLFLVEESPEAEERKQSRIAESVFSNGNQLYWASLVALLVQRFSRRVLEGVRRRPRTTSIRGSLSQAIRRE